VVIAMDQALHCTCPAGLQRIGCDHVLAIGEAEATHRPRAVPSVGRQLLTDAELDRRFDEFWGRRSPDIHHREGVSTVTGAV